MTHRVLGGDTFRLTCTSADASAAFARITVRQDNGQDVPYEIPLTPASDRTSVSVDSDKVAEDGEVTSVFVALVSEASGVKYGMNWAGLFIRGRNGLIRDKLCAGYIYDGGNLGLEEFHGRLDYPGRNVDNEATAILVNATDLTRTITVPTNTRWRLYGGEVFNNDNVTRDVRINVTNGTRVKRVPLSVSGLGAGDRKDWPRASDTSVQSNEPGEMGYPYPLEEGDEIIIKFFSGGASAGGTGNSSALVEEVIEV